jgi:Holliday junction resolvase RusA-like endonuclease
LIKFTYHGEAVGKGRPRYSKRGDYVHTYTPKKTKDFEDAIRFEFMASNCEAMPVYDREKSLQANVLIGVSVPKSYPKYKQALCRCRMIAPTKKPDIDNILKSIMDALNGYAFAYDVQIVKVVAEKVYADAPFVEVEIDEFR